MSQEKISKKELLEQTGISYGQLYRWKRERLIPEEWFIKQSSFTGQETYFPKEQVLARVHAILEKKDSYSLDDMAKLFSPEPGSSIAASDLANFTALNQKMFAQLQQGNNAREQYETGEAVFLASLSDFIDKQGFSAEAAAALAEATLAGVRSKDISVTSSTLFKTVQDSQSFHVVFYSGNTTSLFDSGIEVLGQLPLQETAQQLGSFIQNLDQDNKPA